MALPVEPPDVYNKRSLCLLYRSTYNLSLLYLSSMLDQARLLEGCKKWINFFAEKLPDELCFFKPEELRKQEILETGIGNVISSFCRKEEITIDELLRKKLSRHLYKGLAKRLAEKGAVTYLQHLSTNKAEEEAMRINPNLITNIYLLSLFYTSGSISKALLVLLELELNLRKASKVCRNRMYDEMEKPFRSKVSRIMIIFFDKANDTIITFKQKIKKIMNLVIRMYSIKMKKDRGVLMAVHFCKMSEFFPTADNKVLKEALRSVVNIIFEHLAAENPPLSENIRYKRRNLKEVEFESSSEDEEEEEDKL